MMKDYYKKKIIIPSLIFVSALPLSFAQCSDNNYIGVLISTILCAFIFHSWLNDVNGRPYINVWLHGAWDLIISISIAGVFFVIASLFIPNYTCYTAKAKVAELLLSTTQFRADVNEYYSNNRAFENIKITNEDGYYHLITQHGEIFAFKEDPGALLISTPKVVGDRLEWSCKLYPSSLHPNLCDN